MFVGFCRSVCTHFAIIPRRTFIHGGFGSTHCKEIYNILLVMQKHSNTYNQIILYTYIHIIIIIQFYNILHRCSTITFSRTGCIQTATVSPTSFTVLVDRIAEKRMEKHQLQVVFVHACFETCMLDFAGLQVYTNVSSIFHNSGQNTLSGKVIALMYLMATLVNPLRIWGPSC